MEKKVNKRIDISAKLRAVPMPDITDAFAKLSKREKCLIYILIIVLILAGGVMLLVKPAMEKHDKINEQLIVKQQEQTETQWAISQIPVTESNITDCKKNIKKIKSEFNEILLNEDLDSLITNMVVASGLKPVSLMIGAEGENHQNDQENDGTLSDNSSNPVLSDTQESHDAVRATMVTVNVKGSMRQMLSLIGAANAKKGIVIKSFSISGNDNGDESDDAVLKAVLKSNKSEKVFPYKAQVIFKVYQSREA